MLLVVNVPLAGASAWLRGSLFGRALQSKQKPLPGRLARASAPAEVSFVRTGTRSAARSDDLNAFRGLERRRTHCYIRIQRRELALKVDSNVTNRVYISTLLGSLKTGAYGSA